MLLLLVTPKQLPSQELPAEGRSVDLGVAVSQANWKVAERLYKKYGTVNFPMSSSDQPPDALARVVAGGRYPSNVFSATGGIDWLLARGASIDGYKGAPLRNAVADKTGELLTYLLEKGANPHLFDTAKGAPLHFAMSDGSWKCFDILMARRVDVNKQISQEGQTPLMWAAQYGNEKIAKRLIMAGATLDLRQPTTQMSALHFAVKNDHASMVAFLLRHGASRRVRNAEGQTPFQFAKAIGAKKSAAKLAGRD